MALTSKERQKKFQDNLKLDAKKFRALKIKLKDKELYLLTKQQYMTLKGSVTNGKSKSLVTEESLDDVSSLYENEDFKG
jgi:hypothetical protein